VVRLTGSVVVLCLVSLLWFAPAAFAQDNPFAGTWALDVEKSKIDTSPLPKSESRIYGTNVEGALTIVVEGVAADGALYAYGATGDINGRSYPVVGRDVGARILGDVISWSRIDPATVDMTIKKKGEVINTTRHSVSADGRMLTVTENGVDENDKPVHSVLVYDRQ